MPTAQRATRGLISATAIIGLCVSPLLLARPGTYGG